MSVFAALFYTSAREIPTLLYTSSLKNTPEVAIKCQDHNQTMKTPDYITVLDYFYKKNEYIFLFRSERSEGAGRGGGGGVEGTNSRLLFFAT